MAGIDQTIDAETATTTMASADEFLIWRTANGDARKISKANALGLVAAGNVLTLSTYSLTLQANSVLNGSVVGNMTGGGTFASGGFTGTLPATGTFDLLGTAQTLTALKTFSAGLTFGQDTFNYYDEGNWTPEDGSGAGITFSSPVGRYTRIGRVVMASFAFTYGSSASGATALISFNGASPIPFTPAALSSTTAGGGFIFATTYSSDVVWPRVVTDKTIQLLTKAGTLTNTNVSTLLFRGTVFFVV